jgi:hypothetical protein
MPAFIALEAGTVGNGSSCDWKGMKPTGFLILYGIEEAGFRLSIQDCIRLRRTSCSPEVLRANGLKQIAWR